MAMRLTWRVQVAARLVGGHKAAVTALLALPSREPGGPDALVSAGADGTVAVWEPSASASATPDRYGSCPAIWTPRGVAARTMAFVTRGHLLSGVFYLDSAMYWGDAWGQLLGRHGAEKASRARQRSTNLRCYAFVTSIQPVGRFVSMT